MTESTLEDTQTVALHTTTAEALRTMDRAGVDVLPVLTSDGGSCAGVVLRRALERGCLGMGHDGDTCPVLHHLKRDVAQVTEQELDAHGSAVRGSSRPVVVLDRHGRPTSAFLGEGHGQR